VVSRVNVDNAAGSHKPIVTDDVFSLGITHVDISITGSVKLNFCQVVVRLAVPMSVQPNPPVPPDPGLALIRAVTEIVEAALAQNEKVVGLP
jgi:hypothetical protein